MLNDPSKHFTPERGTGQGGTLSPENWNLFFDILLRSLERIVDPGLHFHSIPPYIHHIRDIAYADDLLTMASSLHFLRLKAMIVQAFADIFGLTIAHQKLTGFHIDYNKPLPSFHTPNSSYSVHLPRGPGRSMTIPLTTVHPAGPHQPTFKYLGITFDFNNTSSTQTQQLRARITSASSRVILSRASYITKKLVLQSHVGGLLNFYTPMLQSSLTSVSKVLDPLLNRTWRKISWNTNTFPTQLLHISTGLGGLNLFSVADKAQECKARHALKTAHRSTYHRSVICALLLRTGHLVPDGPPDLAIIQARSVPPTGWASSLMEYLSLLGLTMAIPLPATCDIAPSDRFTLITQHQTIKHDGDILRVLGYDPALGVVATTAWETVYHPTADIAQLAPYPGYPYQLYSHFPQPFACNPLPLVNPTLMLCSNPMEPNQVTSLREVRKMSHLPLIPHSPWWVADLRQAISLMGPTTIYTDATFLLTPRNPLEGLFPPPTGTLHSGAAALVFVPVDPRHHVTLVRIPDANASYSSAFALELLALSSALAIAHWLSLPVKRIVSDCKSAIALIERHRRRPLPNPAYHHLLSILPPGSTTPLQWIRAHPERRHQSTDEWSFDEQMNAVADHLAANPLFPRVGPSEHPHVMLRREYTGYEIPASDFLPPLLPHSTPYISDPAGTPSALQGTANLRAQQRSTQYLLARDHSRANAYQPREPLWTHTSPATTARAAHFASATAKEQAFLNRLMWDKHMHGGNLHKNSNPELHPPGPCPLCSQPDSLRHWTVECPHPPLP
jgi:hypothetical protein